ncbi:hypothetical protein DIPPA_23360 [Diplonema papillatum]|nr:hypothetical protein DIPPA_23360 [Diplonema papillatum]
MYRRTAPRTSSFSSSPPAARGPAPSEPKMRKKDSRSGTVQQPPRSGSRTSISVPNGHVLEAQRRDPLCPP